MGEPIELGDKARDGITGFEGTVTAIAEYLGGSARALVTSRAVKDDGQPIEWWFEIGRLSKQ